MHIIGIGMFAAAGLDLFMWDPVLILGPGYCNVAGSDEITQGFAVAVKMGGKCYSHVFLLVHIF